MFRRGWFLVLSCAVVAIVFGVLALAHLRHRAAGSRLPERGSTEERIAGCPARVEVAFDRQGVPHVRTESRAALWFAHGYLHARDRFFQMELSRRVASGRLSEVFGRDALDNDRKMRTLRLASTGRRQLAQLDADELAVLDAYAAGVNAALQRFGRWIAPEIWLLGVDPDPWRPEDSLAIGLLLELELSWAMGQELERGLQLTRLGRERAIDLWGWTSGDARAWIPPGNGVRHPFRDHEPITPPLGGFGSNAWAIAPRHSSSGRALLASDPHLGVQMPGTFTAVHLDGPGVHVAGLSIAGAPGVLIGHNEDVAWGLTVSMVDDQDLFVLTLDDSGSRELVDGRWQPLRTITENIPIRWQESPELVKVRMSVHGPLVREQRDESLALAWTGYHGPSVLRTFMKMNRASNVRELAEAWSGVVGPSLSLVAADTGGSILHQVVGQSPVRRRGAGRLPSPGSESAWAWSEFRSLGDLQSIDPAEGFVVAANHDLFGEGDFPEAQRFPGEFAPPWRARRIRQVVAASSDWTIDGCVELQSDVVSGRAIALLKMLRPHLERHGGLTAEQLMIWDGRLSPSSQGAALFESLLLALGEAVGSDEAFRSGLGSTPIGASELLRLLAGGLDETWWDDVETPSVEARDEIIDAILDRFDEHITRDTWGDIHSVAFSHPMTRSSALGWLLADSWNRGPFAIGGGNDTVNAQYWSRSSPFSVAAIPAARFVADVGAWDQTVLVLPIGQSGRPWSPHYSDQLATWMRGGSHTLAFSETAVDREAIARLEMVPAAPSGPAGTVGPDDDGE
jgi:penicillin amidase